MSLPAKKRMRRYHDGKVRFRWNSGREGRAMTPDSRLRNLRRRVNHARNFPFNTCPASRHVYLMAEALAAGKPYPMLTEEPLHCAESLLSVLESLWKARTRLARGEKEKLC